MARAGWIAPHLILLGAEVARVAWKLSACNIVESLGNTPKHVREKQIGNFLKADAAYGLHPSIGF